MGACLQRFNLLFAKGLIKNVQQKKGAVVSAPFYHRHMR